VETALPKVGGRIRFVAGTYRGEIGTLIEKSTDLNKAVVQLIRLAEVCKCSLDDICGFV
jgi:hypothetical protein